MEYTINKVSKMAGVSARTLRYYDEIGLLKPERINSSGYRIYGEKEIDSLQQILFYREMGIELLEIKKILENPNFNELEALTKHLLSVISKRNQMDILIRTLEKTINFKKGECEMKNNEKFEGLKNKLVNDNEEKYGKEVRKKYGNEVVEEYNDNIKNMTQEKFTKAENLKNEVSEVLKMAYEEGNPASELAQKACDLHKQWLMLYYKGYNKEYHKGLAEMYVQDERFTAFYDKIAVGCTKFFRDAILIYCK